MSLVKPEKNDFRAAPIREINLERQREESEEPKKDSKLKPMD